MVPIKLSDVKVGSYIGVAAMPQSDGSQKAISVSIFPEAARGVGEGFRPWDVRPNSSMTNATVAESVAGNDGQTLLVKYKDGEKKIIVSPDTPIVTTVAGDKSGAEDRRVRHHQWRDTQAGRHAGSRAHHRRSRRHASDVA